jgi:hypothetical protein
MRAAPHPALPQLVHSLDSVHRSADTPRSRTGFVGGGELNGSNNQHDKAL